jgi:hypothetical protein
MIIDRVGMAKVNAGMARLGLSSTLRGDAGRTAWEENRENLSTPTSRPTELLYKGEILSPRGAVRSTASSPSPSRDSSDAPEGTRSRTRRTFGRVVDVGSFTCGPALHRLAMGNWSQTRARPSRRSRIALAPSYSTVSPIRTLGHEIIRCRPADLVLELLDIVAETLESSFSPR